MVSSRLLTTNGAAHQADRVIALLLIVLSAIGSVTAVRWGWSIISHSTTGLDVTDEGYYLSVVEFPGLIPHAPTDYGAYLRNVWLLTGRNIPLFRVAGYLLLAGASLVFSLILHGHNTPGTRLVRWTTVFATTVIVLAGASYQYVLWIVTPNYNLLTLVILLPIAGLLVRLLLDEVGTYQVGKSRVVAPHHLGLGAGLVPLFAVRFTAATVVSLVYLLALILASEKVTRRQGVKSLLQGVTVGLILHLLLARRWPWTSASLWLRSIELSNLRNDHPPSVIWELDFFRSDVRPWITSGIGVLVLVLIVRVVVRNNLARHSIALLIAVVTVVSMWSSKPAGGGPAAALGVGWWWLRLFFYFSLAAFLLSDRVSRHNLVGPAVMLLGIAGALGSANGMYRQTIFMLGLFVAGLVAQAVTNFRYYGPSATVLLPTCAALGMVLVVVLSSADGAVKSPYRLQGPIDSNRTTIEVGEYGRLSVHPNTADFVRWVQGVKIRIPSGSRCVVNLEGGTPVIPLILGVTPAVSNWQLGGYPGSDQAEKRGLSLDTCWRKGPFLLVTSTNSFRAIKVPEEVLARCAAPPLSERYVQITYGAHIVATLCND